MNDTRYVFRTRSVGPLEEIHITLGQFLVREITIVVPASAVLAALIAGFSAVIILLAALVADRTQLGAVPYRAAVVFGWAWFSVTALTAVRVFIEAVANRLQHFRANDDLFIVEIGNKQREHKFAECTWKHRDPFTLERWFGEGARLVVFCDGETYYLGVSDKAAVEWSQWLKSHEAKEIAGNSGGSLSFLWFLALSWCGSVIGGFLALAVVLILRLMGDFGNAQQTVIMLGYLDGFLAVCCRELFHGRQFHRYGSLASALFLALACAVLVLPLRSLPWQIAALNPLVGAIVGWLAFPGKSREET